MTAPLSGPIAVIVAMDAELVHLVGDLGSRSGEIGGRPRYDIEVAGQSVVAVRCGIGMLNAAAATERVVAEVAPAAILNYGCAGAHRRDILPGDVVIGERVVYTAALNILRDGTERHTGFRSGGSDDATRFAAHLDADTGWLDAARVVAASHTVAPWPDDHDWPVDVPRRGAALHVGAVASADVWTQEIARLTTIAERHDSLCEDMEAAAIAHVAALHGVPCLSVKDISNNELLAVSDLDDFSDFPTAEVGRRAAAFLRAVIAAAAATRRSR